jgi:hypothetical protein
MNFLSVGVSHCHLSIETAEERQQQIQHDQRNQHEAHECLPLQNKGPLRG